MQCVGGPRPGFVRMRPVVCWGDGAASSLHASLKGPNSTARAPVSCKIEDLLTVELLLLLPSTRSSLPLSSLAERRSWMRGLLLGSSCCTSSDTSYMLASPQGHWLTYKHSRVPAMIRGRSSPSGHSRTMPDDDAPGPSATTFVNSLRTDNSMLRRAITSACESCNSDPQPCSRDLPKHLVPVQQLKT